MAEVRRERAREVSEGLLLAAFLLVPLVRWGDEFHGVKLALLAPLALSAGGLALLAPAGVRPGAKGSPLPWVGFFFAWTALTLLWAESRPSAAVALLWLAPSCGVYLAARTASPRGLLWGAFLPVLPVALYGLAQAEGWLPTPVDLYGTPNASSFLGHANWAGEFVAAALAGSLGLRGERRTGARLLLGAGWLLGAAYLAAATGRGAWFGMAAGCAAAAAIRLLPRTGAPRPEFRIRRAWLPALVLVALCAAVASRGGGSARRKASELAHAPGAVLAVRWETWKTALRAVRAHPIGGAGAGGFETAAPRFLTAGLERETGSSRVRADHVHNDLIERAVDGGGVGLLLFVALVGAALRRAFASGGPEGAGLGGIVVSILASGLFAFPLERPATALLFWGALGALDGGDPASPAPSRGTARRIAAGALVLLGLAGGWAGVREARGYHAYLEGVADLDHGDDARGLRSLDRAVREWPPEERYWSARAEALRSLGRGDEAAESLSRALRFHPYEGRLWRALGATLSDGGSYDEARRAFERAAALLPAHRTEVSADLGVVALRRGDLGEARRLLGPAVERTPEDPALLVDWGLLLRKEGRFDEARSSLLRAATSPADRTAALANLAELEIRRGRASEASRLLEGALRQRDDDEGGLLHYNLACARALSGKRAGACEALREALRRRPDLLRQASTDEDLKALRGGKGGMCE